MGQILLNTPQGKVKVNIAGDAPTAEEQSKIIEQFYPDQVAPVAQRRSIDFATAKPDEVREYIRQMRAAGLDPKTGDQLTEEEFISTYKEEGVDYGTGLDDVEGFSRFQFGRMETPEEKAAYLSESVGPDGFRQDALGRFIVNQKGRQILGMGEGPDIAVDEEGLSFGDLKEFAGSAGAPIVAGVGAALMTSGLGFIPGALMVAGSASAAKLVDEAIESAEGLQRQTLSEVGRDAAFEGVFAFLGEGIGRGISNIAGRVIKGPGGEANEVLRQQFRERLQKGLRPTIAGGTSEEFRPILTRLQAVYEGVFPNRKAAENNLKILMDDLKKSANVNTTNLKAFEDAVQSDIDVFYGQTSDLLADAQKQLDLAVEGEIKNVMKPLMEGKDVSKELADALQLRKSLFDEKVDQLYTSANQVLSGKAIMSTKGIKDTLRAIDTEFGADIMNSKIGRDISGLQDYITPAEMQTLRKKLVEATGTPDIVNNASYAALSRLKNAVNTSFDETQLRMQQTVNMMKEGAGINSPDASRGLTGLMTEEQAIINNMGLSMEVIADGLDTLTRANRLYGIGMRRFDNPVTRKIIKKARDGQINMPFIYEQIIAKDNPEALGQLFRAIRGVPELEMTDLAESARFASQQRIGNMSAEEALEIVSQLPKGNRRRVLVEKAIEDAERTAKARASIRGTGAQAAEELRKRLGSMYLEDVFSKSKLIETTTGAKVIDPVRLAAELKKKGTTINRLFAKEQGQLDDLIKVLETGRASIAPDVLRALPDMPLKQQMEMLKKATITQKEITRSQIYKAFEAGDVDEIARMLLSKPSAVDDARRVYANDPAKFEMAKDAAMGRIIRQIGGTIEDGGQIRLQGNFVEDFQSGALGKNLQSVLESYGEGHIDKLFGKNTYNTLYTIADDMTAASNAAIKGKGGLAAPQIALTLGVVGLLTNPVATITTGVGYSAMSKLLRNPQVLKAMMASRRKLTVKEFLQGKRVAQDPIGQGLQAALQLAAAAATQATRGNVQQVEQEAAPAIEMGRQQAEQRVPELGTQLQNIGTQVQQKFTGATQPQQVSPILVPDPQTRATFGIQ